MSHPIGSQGGGMTSPHQRFGLSCALSTPFAHSGAIDYGLLIGHAGACLAEGCDSVTLFGTTGEGASLSGAERQATIDAFIAAGFNARTQLIGCVAASALDDAVMQCRMLYNADCRAVLLAPPFYFKGVSDDGVFAWFSQLFQRLAPAARDIILYHIPGVTGVALSVSLIGRLRAAFPQLIIGVKDSSGDWPYTQDLLKTHADLAILVGDERHLAHGVRLGGQGAISGMANVIAPLLREMTQSGREDGRVLDLVGDVLKHPVVPVIKLLIAAKRGDPVWEHVRPPLVPVKAADAVALVDRVLQLSRGSGP